MQNREKIEKLLKEELLLHPNARLLDIFKIFYQSAFGPGHIILDEDSAKRFLKDELDNIKKFEDIQYQSICWKNDYYRVNLSVIADGLVSFDEYFTAFINSATPQKEISWDDWKLEWKEIEEYLEERGYIFSQQEEDETIINEILLKKITAFSHNKTYKELYEPHYRIISKEELKKIGLVNL